MNRCYIQQYRNPDLAIFYEFGDNFIKCCCRCRTLILMLVKFVLLLTESLIDPLQSQILVIVVAVVVAVDIVVVVGKTMTHDRCIKM